VDDEWLLDLRPRERAPVKVSARIIAAAEPLEVSLRWIVRRIDPVVTSSQNYDAVEDRVACPVEGA
jgi:hypothetical protein